MLKFKCEECGRIFHTPKAVNEDRGEFWGMPAYETVYYCPYCDSEAIYEVSESTEDEE